MSTSATRNEQILQRVTCDFTTSNEQRVKSYALKHLRSNINHGLNAPKTSNAPKNAKTRKISENLILTNKGTLKGQFYLEMASHRVNNDIMQTP